MNFVFICLSQTHREAVMKLVNVSMVCTERCINSDQLFTAELTFDNQANWEPFYTYLHN